MLRTEVMAASCCRHIIGEVRQVPSPFVRVVATGYYDGPTDGLVECGSCGTLYEFCKLDWDEGQDMRIFSLAPVPGRTLSEIEQSASGRVTPTRPTWVLTGEFDKEIEVVVQSIVAAASDAEFVIATENLLSTIEVWRPVGFLGDLDWFVELGLDRRGRSTISHPG
jgi:hypothetical protein